MFVDRRGRHRRECREALHEASASTHLAGLSWSIPVLILKYGLFCANHLHTAASVCILELAATDTALGCSYGGEAQASSKSSIFQLSLVISLRMPRECDTAAETELQRTKRTMLASLVADSSALMAPAIDGVMTSLGSGDMVVSEARCMIPQQSRTATSKAFCTAMSGTWMTLYCPER